MYSYRDSRYLMGLLFCGMNLFVISSPNNDLPT